MPTSKQCYQCGNDNTPQAFCGACGSPLAINDYISIKVKEQLADTIRDRDVLEMDSSIKVFKQAWGWIRLVFGIAVGLLVLTGRGVFWKVSDFWSGVDKAKQSVIEIAKKSSDEIARSSAQSKQDISNTQAEISRQTASLRSDIEDSRQQLQTASKIQPEMERMRKQLAQATNDIQAQQKVISSSEEFAKSIFSSHMVQIFNIGQSPKDRYVVIPPATKDIKNTVVLLLLDAAPIQETIQLQYHIYLQPPNSYLNFHNLVVFFWGDSAENLQQKSLSVSYFPDKSDKEIIHSLSEHDGRVFADDQPLPHFGQPDPGFKGNKWMPVLPSLNNEPGRTRRNLGSAPASRAGVT